MFNMKNCSQLKDQLYKNIKPARYYHKCYDTTS